MLDSRVEKNGKTITLDNGVELLYCEFGKENQEVLISGAFYFITFNPFLEELAKKYHVYGVVMRPNGKTTEHNEDGTVNWSRQWGEDIYQFAKAIGLESFHYAGKCHGTNPGWYLLKEHPEMVRTLASISMLPHVFEQDQDQWNSLQAQEGPSFMRQVLVKQELLPAKIADVQTVGGLADIDPQMAVYGSHPEKIFASYEETRAFLRAVQKPILLMFGTEDILYHDFYKANIEGMHLIPGVRTVLLQGEKHLLEMDMPKR